MLYTIIAWIVLGALGGFLARAIMPGAQNYSLGLTIILGIVGALVGGGLMHLLGIGSGRDGGDVVNIPSIIVAALGALLVVFLYSKFAGGARRV